MILNTERLVLRPITVADSRLVYPLMSDPEIMAHWDVEPITDPEAVDAAVALQAQETEAGTALSWIVRTLSGTFIGVCDLTGMDMRHRRAEVSFMLGKNARGQGYGFEAMQAVVEHAAALHFKRLMARTHVGDTPSEKLLARLGFEEEGYLRGHVERDGERRDCRQWGLLL